MEFWKEDIIRQIKEWDSKKTPLLLLGPSGIGKTTAAEMILNDYQILRFYPTHFHDSKNFVKKLDEILNQRSILEIMKVGKSKAIIIEEIDKTSSSEKNVLNYLIGIKFTECPIILTAQKPEKRHRELLRSCHTIKITELNENTIGITAPMKLAIQKKETDLRKILHLRENPNWKPTTKTDEISELAFQILRNETSEIPDTVSLTEKSIIVSTLLENLNNAIPEWFTIFTDRALSRIFHDERWDLIRVLDDYIFPFLIQQIQSKKVSIKSPFFTRTLSYSSTRSLNRKTILSHIGKQYNDPIIGFELNINSLPTRFRIQSLYDENVEDF